MPGKNSKQGHGKPTKASKTINQGTQTDGVYEIKSMKKEGVKFVASRIYNYEAKRATGNFEICCIADDHFFLGSQDEKVENKLDVIQKTITKLIAGSKRRAQVPMIDISSPEALSEQACMLFVEIQSKDKKEYERWEEHISNYEFKCEELTLPSENATMMDKMTQYGEDNPDEDFSEGIKFMAMKILESESERLDIEINDCNSISECPDPGDCSKWPDCDDKCFKYYCNDCHSWDNKTRSVIYECKCNCRKRECNCELEDWDFDPDDIDNSDNLEEFDESDITDDNDDSEDGEDTKIPVGSGECEEKCDCKDRSYSEECDCEDCNCAEVKRQESFLYSKYQVWRSKTPGQE